MNDGHDSMLSWVAGLSSQLRDGGDLTGLDDFRADAGRPARVVLCGMGGSAMAGALLPELWLGRPLPWTVHRDAGLPPWVDANTLVIASSYSGETTETLAALAEARARGCSLVALTSGGRVAAASRGEDGGPPFPAVLIPGGQPPRTALGYSFAGLVHALHRLGLADDPQPALTATADHLDAGPLVRIGSPQKTPVGGDAARDFASGLARRFVMIYTSGREAHAVGRRWQAQLNENAKLPAAVAEFPELCHNEIVGWDLDSEWREAFALIVLRAGEEALERRRADAALDLVVDQFPEVRQVHAVGGDSWIRAFGLIQFGDYVSCAVARRRGVDPVSIDRIDALKARMQPKE